MDENKCIVKCCDRKIDVKKHKLCKVHANELYKNGVIKAKPLRVNKKHDKIIIV